MGKPHRLGLVVGKFAPLHLGHEHVIETARSASDRILLISYAQPEHAGCEPERRRVWLRTRFPSAQVLVLDRDSWSARRDAPRWPADDEDPELHRAFVGHLCHDLLGEHPDAVFSSEAYGPELALALTRYFAALAVPNPEVTHVAVDPARARIPISGTLVRTDVHAHRRFLSSEVYSSFVERVAILGGESSGKSTLAEALATHFETAHVAEYGRTLWIERNGHLEYDDLLAIARRQIADEEAAARNAQRFLFCDTTPLVTRFYSQEMFGRVDPELSTLSTRGYDFTVLCAPDFEFHQDGTRRDDAFRQRQDAFYRENLERSGQSYLVVSGSVEARVHQVETALARRSGTGVTSCRTD